MTDSLNVRVNGEPVTKPPVVGDVVTFPDYPAYGEQRITSVSTTTKDGVVWVSHVLKARERDD